MKMCTQGKAHNSNIFPFNFRNNLLLRKLLYNHTLIKKHIVFIQYVSVSCLLYNKVFVV